MARGQRHQGSMGIREQRPWVRARVIGLCLFVIFTAPSTAGTRADTCADGRQLDSPQCDCTSPTYTYVIDPQPKTWLDTQQSVSLRGQCGASDISVAESTGTFRNFSQHVAMGRTFYHPNYYSANYSTLCNATTCVNSTNGIGGVSYELSDLQKNFPSGVVYVGLPPTLKFDIDVDVETCWGNSPWYRLQPGFSRSDAKAVLCAGADSVAPDNVDIKCSTSTSTLLRMVQNNYQCLHRTSWFVFTLLNSLTVINADNSRYNDPAQGIYNWASVQQYFSVQDFSDPSASHTSDSRLLSIQMPTLGLLSTCPFGGQTFQQVSARGFRANLQTSLGRVNIVVYENGTALPDDACVCPEKPVWVRVSNNIFAQNIRSVLSYYQVGSIVTILCGCVILLIYLRAPYLQRQPYSSMVRMGMCDALFATSVLIWSCTSRDFKTTPGELGSPAYSAENFEEFSGDPYGNVDIPTVSCQYFSSWTQLFMSGSLFYYTSVSVHLHQNILNPFYAPSTSKYDTVVWSAAVFSVFVMGMFAAANHSLLDGYSQFLFCWYRRDVTTNSSSLGELNWPMWVTFYLPLFFCMGYTLWVSQSARKSLNDGLQFSSTARNHVLSTNRRFVLVNVGLWMTVGVPTLMVWLSPSTCVPISTLSVYGILLGLRGISNLVLWTLCIPGLFDMLRIQYRIRNVQLRKICFYAYQMLCPCFAGPRNAPAVSGGLEPLLSVETELSRSLSFSSELERPSSSDSTPTSFGGDPPNLDPMLNLRARHKEIVAQQSEADYFLRAEVIWLVSWGTLFNLVKHVQPRGDTEWDEDHLFWPENHSIQEMNSLKQILTVQGASVDQGSTWSFMSFNPRYGDSYKLTMLRHIFSEAAAACTNPATRAVPNKFSQDELYDLDEQVPCDSRQLKRTHVQHLPQWELGYVFSMCPETRQISIIAKEKFNIGGKSGAPFYFTHDSVYIIKMITETESVDFTRFFDSYFTFMTSKNSEGEYNNLQSLLLRVYGCHSVRTRATQAPQHFLVMANVLNFPHHVSLSGVRVPSGQCERRYDLKGSSAGREEMKPAKLRAICESEVSEGAHQTDLPTLLDNDYRLEQSLGLGIRIRPQHKKQLMKQMIKDCVFLASENVMDYSMLIARWRRLVMGTEAPQDSAEGVMHALHVVPHAEEEHVWYYFGFIDVTQHYNFNKKAERFLKRVFYCRDPNTMSACPPVQYARRFLLEMNNYIEPVLDNFESEVDLMFEHCGLFWARYD